MLMRNSNSGAFEVYDISNNTITFSAPMGQVGLEWTVAGFGDFSTRANETDMLMRNSNTGAFELYDIVNNAITLSTGMGQVGLEWTIAGFGDFSTRANETDMLMRNSNTGAFEVYDVANNAITSARTDGPGRSGMDDRGLWRFLRQCQRNRHADAQQQHRRVRTLRHPQQCHRARQPGWAKSAWNGRSAAFRAVRPACRRPRNSAALPSTRRERLRAALPISLPRQWRRSRRATARLPHPRRSIRLRRRPPSISSARRTSSRATYWPDRNAWRRVGSRCAGRRSQSGVRAGCRSRSGRAWDAGSLFRMPRATDMLLLG